MGSLNGMRSGTALLLLLDLVACLAGLWKAEKFWLRFFLSGAVASASSPRGLSGGNWRQPSRLFNLYVLLCPDKDIPHLGDIVLHEMFVKRVGDLQPTDDGNNVYVLITVVYQGHLALKIVDIVLQTLPQFYLDCKKMIIVSLKFPLRS